LQPDKAAFRNRLPPRPPYGRTIGGATISAIPDPTGKGKPFPIKDALTVHEAAMVYAGRHPYRYDFGPYDTRDWRARCLRLLKVGLAETPQKSPRAQRSWDIFCELLERIKGGQIKPIKPAYDLTGNIDPFETKISIDDVVQLAKDRGEDPKYLRPFVAAAEARAVNHETTTTPRKTTKTEAVATHIREKYPDGIPADVTYKTIANECSVHESTVRRVLGSKK
jgi:hypothetical protein